MTFSGQRTRGLIRQWPSSTLSYTKETITVRLDKDVRRPLARVVKLSLEELELLKFMANKFL